MAQCHAVLIQKPRQYHHLNLVSSILCSWPTPQCSELQDLLTLLPLYVLRTFADTNGVNFKPICTPLIAGQQQLHAQIKSLYATATFSLRSNINATGLFKTGMTGNSYVPCLSLCESLSGQLSMAYKYEVQRASHSRMYLRDHLAPSLCTRPYHSDQS